MNIMHAPVGQIRVDIIRRVLCFFHDSTRAPASLPMNDFAHHALYFLREEHKGLD